MTQARDVQTPPPDFIAVKHDIVKELFLKTADQTYVVARWCFLNRLYLDFYWNAVHALEKHLKTVLLMNGRSASRSLPGVDGLSTSFQRPDGRKRAKKPGRYVLVRPDILD